MTDHPTHRMNPTPCPFCGKPLDAASPTEGSNDRQPSDGDLSMCIYCGEWIVFNADLTFRKPNDEEYEEVARDPQLRWLRNAWTMTKGGARG